MISVGNILPQSLRLDWLQGSNEQRSELYITYIERAAELLTWQTPKSIGGAYGSAIGQAGAAQGLWL
jgi:hypothetical protein